MNIDPVLEKALIPLIPKNISNVERIAAGLSLLRIRDKFLPRSRSSYHNRFTPPRGMLQCLAEKGWHSRENSLLLDECGGPRFADGPSLILHPPNSGVSPGGGRAHN